MSGARDTRADAVLRDALALDAPERSRYVEAACAGDADLRAEVEELLRLAFEPAPALEPGVLADGPLVRDALEAAAAASTLTPDETVGAWRVVREIGRGGMATVYLVERAESGFEQRGALKLVRASAASEEIAWRLQQERRILATLTHPDIARLLDGGQTADGRPYLVMELVDGRPIDRYCDELRLTVGERIALFLRVCRAVQYAHRHLVVHGDLKPLNIVVTTDHQVKLLDFGIARLISPAAAQAGDAPAREAARALTPDYASPEQVRGGEVGIGSDVYQLGLVLYALLTGARPQAVTDVTPDALARVVCEAEPVHPSERAGAAGEATAARRRTTPKALARALRGDLDAIVLCALRKDPAGRYASVGELVADIERHRTRFPVHARSGGPGYRASRFAARHRIAVGWAVALLVLAAVVLPAWAAQRWRAAQEAARAEQIERVIQDLFAFPRPRVRAEPPTGATFLDHAAQLVQAELEGQRSSQARLLTLLGRSYNALGHYDRSVDVLEQALTLGRAQSGPSSLEVAETLEWLGQSQHYLGRYEAAEASVREALAIRTSRLGADDPHTVRLAIELGDLQHTRGALADAEQTLRGAVDTLRAVGATATPESLDHDSLPRAIRDLASTLRDRGRLDEAAARFHEAVAMFTALHGEDSQQVATTQVYAVRLHVLRSELDLAEATIAAALDTLRRVYEGDHALLGVALATLGYLRTEQSRYDEASVALEEAQRITRELLGEAHPLVGRTAAHEAELALRRGRWDEAVTHARLTLATLARSGLTDHPAAIDARTTLGEALLALGEREAAVRELGAGLDLAERQYDDGDRRILRLRRALGRALDAPPARR
jgi:eukaryotic-like serine/threonine-protein kinase